jgi:hypothetical protein
MYYLYNWNLEVTHGYLRFVGDLEDGRGWETSSVERLETTRGGYRVTTRNSVYFLPW